MEVQEEVPQSTCINRAQPPLEVEDFVASQVSLCVIWRSHSKLIAEDDSRHWGGEKPG